MKEINKVIEKINYHWYKKNLDYLGYYAKKLYDLLKKGAKHDKT